ncbi:uncharacterized protein LOC103282517 [Anolis carolinensis]|uniref:uncharacterized protein LOC103282517 n=1 Tax=Anolis carolinensis TaxID=28377 RepID=UPI002F2B8371
MAAPTPPPQPRADMLAGQLHGAPLPPSPRISTPLPVRPPSWTARRRTSRRRRRRTSWTLGTRRASSRWTRPPTCSGTRPWAWKRRNSGETFPDALARGRTEGQRAPLPSGRGSGFGLHCRRPSRQNRLLGLRLRWRWMRVRGEGESAASQLASLGGPGREGTLGSTPLAPWHVDGQTDGAGSTTGAPSSPCPAPAPPRPPSVHRDLAEEDVTVPIGGPWEEPHIPFSSLRLRHDEGRLWDGLRAQGRERPVAGPVGERERETERERERERERALHGPLGPLPQPRADVLAGQLHGAPLPPSPRAFTPLPVRPPSWTARRRTSRRRRRRTSWTLGTRRASSRWTRPPTRSGTRPWAWKRRNSGETLPGALARGRTGQEGQRAPLPSGEGRVWLRPRLGPRPSRQNRRWWRHDLGGGGCVYVWKGRAPSTPSLPERALTLHPAQTLPSLSLSLSLSSLSPSDLSHRLFLHELNRVRFLVFSMEKLSPKWSRWGTREGTWPPQRFLGLPFMGFQSEKGQEGQAGRGGRVGFGRNRDGTRQKRCPEASLGKSFGKAGGAPSVPSGPGKGGLGENWGEVLGSAPRVLGPEPSFSPCFELSGKGRVSAFGFGSGDAWRAPPPSFPPGKPTSGQKIWV